MLNVSSINDRVRERPGWLPIACYPRHGFFVIVYGADRHSQPAVSARSVLPKTGAMPNGKLRVYFNQDGREVFAEETGPLSPWRSFVEWVKTIIRS